MNPRDAETQQIWCSWFRSSIMAVCFTAGMAMASGLRCSGKRCSNTKTTCQQHDTMSGHLFMQAGRGIALCNIYDSVSSESWEMAVFSCHFDMDRLVVVRF